MNNTTWTVLIWGLPVAVIGGLIGDLSYERGYAHGKAEAAAEREFTINKAAQEAQAGGNAKQKQNELDKTCSAWLFETNAKDAKRRICGKQ